MKVFLADTENINPLSQVFPVSRRCIDIIKNILPNLRNELNQEKYEKDNISTINKDNKVKAEIAALCEAVQQHNHGTHVPALLQYGKAQVHSTHTQHQAAAQQQYCKQQREQHQQQGAIARARQQVLSPPLPSASLAPGYSHTHTQPAVSAASHSSVHHDNNNSTRFGRDRHHNHHYQHQPPLPPPPQLLPPPPNPAPLPMQPPLPADRSEVSRGQSKLQMLSNISQRENLNVNTNTLSSSSNRDNRDNYSSSRDNRDNYPSGSISNRANRVNYPSSSSNRDNRDNYPNSSRDNRGNYPCSNSNRDSRSKDRDRHPKDRDYDRKRSREEDRDWERDRGRGRDSREKDRDTDRYLSKAAQSTQSNHYTTPSPLISMHDSYGYNPNIINQTCAPCVSEYNPPPIRPFERPRPQCQKPQSQ